MPQSRTTLSRFFIDQQRHHPQPDADLLALLNDVQTACKFIASAVSRESVPQAGVVRADARASATSIVLRECETGGELRGALCYGLDVPHGPATTRGRYLLVCDALDGALNLDVNITVGTIFGILRAPEGNGALHAPDFLQPGTSLVAAGIALYGPTTMMVLTLGRGVNGFTLDREIGAFTLSHPDMRLPDATREFAVDAAAERWWEPPIRHYVEERIAGHDALRDDDVYLRWVNSLVIDTYRVLVRGGIIIDPRHIGGASHGRRHLLYEANPVAMIIEAAGGAASTGRQRILDVVPADVHERTPIIMGSPREVERIERLHAAYDRGEELRFEAPLFRTRSLFRSG